MLLSHDLRVYQQATSPEEDLLDVCSPVRGQVPQERNSQANRSLCHELRTRGSQCGGDVDGPYTRRHTTGSLLRELHGPTGQPTHWQARFLSEWCTVGKVSDSGLRCQSCFPNEIGAKSTIPKVLRI